MIIIVQVALAVLLFVYSESIREALHKSVDHMFQTAKTDKISRETFSNIEIQVWGTSERAGRVKSCVLIQGVMSAYFIENYI